MKEIKDMTNKELVEEYSTMYYTINGQESCFGTKDLYWFEQLENEISKRNGNVSVRIEVNFEEDEEEADW